jgi:hypothetical protein
MAYEYLPETLDNYLHWRIHEHNFQIGLKRIIQWYLRT